MPERLQFSDLHLRNMEALYDLGLSTHRIGRLYGCLSGSVHTRLVARGVRMRNRSERIHRKAKPRSNGYLFLGDVAEHRLVAEEAIGRPLRPGEEVHHRNGDKTDNRPENLQVLTLVEHRRLHGRQKLAEAAELESRIVELRSAGLTNREIAEKVGATYHVVCNRTARLIRAGRLAKRGATDRPGTVLDEALVCRLRQAARSGARVVDLAKQHGLNYTAVGHAVRGLTWAHAAEPPVPPLYRRKATAPPIAEEDIE